MTASGNWLLLTIACIVWPWTRAFDTEALQTATVSNSVSASAAASQYPYFGAIVAKEDGDVVCGSVLLSKNAILTAASCMNGDIATPDSVHIYINGEHRLVVDVQIDESHSVALARLSAVVEGISIPDLKLSDDAETATTLGFADMGDVKRLMPVRVKILESADCAWDLNSPLSQNKTCAEADAAGPFGGIVGAPLIGRSGGSDVVVGVVSPSHPDPEQPKWVLGVFMILKLLCWILYWLWRYGC